MHGRFHEQVEDRRDDEELEYQQGDEESDTAEEQGLDQALLAFLQQTDTARAQ